ncbi:MULTISPECIES: hypothetical protein [Roseovarius]|jgi:hypothetical protein|uniref:Uncharacterized protein n=1 Tax=Roseovarius mucosus TaxID=215743 RepID=A0A1V0RKZ1_9RHOB|nr:MULTISPECIES: hypothetical protein [Roseovarius]ARE82401.1 hypothetical protein ROSMUCSMR3_00904 [Roseovarius mucosus]MBW4972724.1 hypothetical protein [Roseovarius mucosus]|tara:strand:+ start:1402 stop:1566 length:165 start_codon:yes stop_codon:yes gene_type:complete
MTMREEPRRETLAEVQRLLARARPDQLRRLLADIQAVQQMTNRDEHASPQRRVS